MTMRGIRGALFSLLPQEEHLPDALEGCAIRSLSFEAIEIYSRGEIGHIEFNSVKAHAQELALIKSRYLTAEQVVNLYRHD